MHSRHISCSWTPVAYRQGCTSVRILNNLRFWTVNRGTNFCNLLNVPFTKFTFPKIYHFQIHDDFSHNSTSKPLPRPASSRPNSSPQSHSGSHSLQDNSLSHRAKHPVLAGGEIAFSHSRSVREPRFLFSLFLLFFLKDVFAAITTGLSAKSCVMLAESGGVKVVLKLVHEMNRGYASQAVNIEGTKILVNLAKVSFL